MYHYVAVFSVGGIGIVENMMLVDANVEVGSAQL